MWKWGGKEKKRVTIPDSLRQKANMKLHHQIVLCPVQVYFNFLLNFWAQYHASLTSITAFVLISTRVSEEFSQKIPEVLLGLCANRKGTEP